MFFCLSASTWVHLCFSGVNKSSENECKTILRPIHACQFFVLFCFLLWGLFHASIHQIPESYRQTSCQKYNRNNYLVFTWFVWCLNLCDYFQKVDSGQLDLGFLVGEMFHPSSIHVFFSQLKESLGNCLLLVLYACMCQVYILILEDLIRKVV